uniref:uncharacterized protein C1orf232 n=1 Tax=Doryrhamphus excisus TaxID=161450 RepID=UPI0025AE4FC5|nr:uncharacterized protein C1orf232 [Doryrhamphus excisus]
MNPLWRVYKSKVLKTLNPEYVEETADEVCETEEDLGPVQEDPQGQNAMSQLARKMQGAGAKSWNRLAAIFNQDDQHQLLPDTQSPPIADHPLAVRPEVSAPPTRRSGFWDSFAANWAARKQAEEDAGVGDQEPQEAVEEEEEQEEEEGGRDGDMNPSEGTRSFSRYVSLGGGEDAPFRWNFVSSKLAELRSKSAAHSD